MRLKLFFFPSFLIPLVMLKGADVSFSSSSCLLLSDVPEITGTYSALCMARLPSMFNSESTFYGLDGSVDYLEGD